jgi:hypothetical protein
MQEVLLRFRDTPQHWRNRVPTALLYGCCLRSMVMLRLLCDLHAPTVWNRILTDNKD